jgi:hypothetical protein
MSWSPDQQRLLGAMGYTLYQRGAPGPAAMPVRLEAPAAANAPARAGASGGLDKLLAALQRAASGRDIAALAGDVEALRGDPLKKRALWPQLRALRRAH